MEEEKNERNGKKKNGPKKENNGDEIAGKRGSEK